MELKITDVGLASFFGLTRQTISKLRTSKRKVELLRYTAFLELYIKMNTKN